MDHIITVTEMARNFGDIIARVHYKGEKFEIKKGSTIVACLAPAKAQATVKVNELRKLFTECPQFSSNEEGEDFYRDLKAIRQLQTRDISSKWD